MNHRHEQPCRPGSRYGPRRRSSRGGCSCPPRRLPTPTSGKVDARGGKRPARISPAKRPLSHNGALAGLATFRGQPEHPPRGMQGPAKGTPRRRGPHRGPSCLPGGRLTHHTWGLAGLNAGGAPICHPALVRTIARLSGRSVPRLSTTDCPIWPSAASKPCVHTQVHCRQPADPPRMCLTHPRLGPFARRGQAHLS